MTESESVYMRLLGPDMDRLPAELRAMFVDGRRVGRGTGVSDVAGTRVRILRPVLAVLAKQGVLFPECARDVPFEIVSRPTPGGALAATRTFRLPGIDRVLTDTLRVVDGNLHDFMGPRGDFEVRMGLAVEGATLRMRSEEQWLRFGSRRVPIPQLSTVAVTESWREDRRHIDVRLSSPVIGE